MLAPLGAASLWEQRALQQAFSGAAALMDPAIGEMGDSLRTLRPLTWPQGAARASLPSPRLLVANAGIYAASLLGELLLGILSTN